MPLIPTDLKANALLHQAVSMEITSFNEYVEKIVAERVWKRYAAKQNKNDHLLIIFKLLQNAGRTFR